VIHSELVEGMPLDELSFGSDHGWDTQMCARDLPNAGRSVIRYWEVVSSLIRAGVDYVASAAVLPNGSGIGAGNLPAIRAGFRCVEGPGVRMRRGQHSPAKCFF